MRWWLRVYPRRLRDRYGDELEHMLSESERPRRDLANVVWHVLRKRLEVTMSDRRFVLGAVAILIGAVSLVAFGYALAELAGGITDVPRHWWSALPVLTFAASVVVAAAAFSSYHRPEEHARGSSR